ncbi:MAG: tyrP 1 [Gammaproteobacteria bacterium]|jgi:tyrosine-specific transport protein|nr:tyrP 1 [Gammaproteobacteria bacterium]
MNKMIGAILLIVGTSIGGGMLALPVATAAGGFLNACILMFACWLAMTFCAFLILEVNLWLPINSNMISMAKITLGQIGQLIAWFTYLLLLYSLLAAYISSGSDVLHSLLTKLNLDLPMWITSVAVVVLLGAVVYQGISAIDYVNRGFMFIKLGAYSLLVVLAIPHVNLNLLPLGELHHMLGAVTVVITSFGYATVIPSLRAYFKGDVKKLRLVILIGSLIPLFCYILWVFVIQANIPSKGTTGLISIAASGREVSMLTHALTTAIHTQWVITCANIFTSICVATAFLGVALCLADFLSDGLQIEKKAWGNVKIHALTFLPPLAIILFYPGAFLIGLSYAGIFCIILLMLLPPLMVWSGRYYKKIARGYRVAGGKPALVITILLAILVLIINKTIG